MDKETKARLETERERVSKARDKEAKALNKERKVDAQFRNLDMPGVELTFHFKGVDWRLEDNGTYKLPVSVIEHLNSLSTPVYETPEQAAKEARHMSDPAPNPERKIVATKARFSVTPVNMNFDTAGKPGGE